MTIAATVATGIAAAVAGLIAVRHGHDCIAEHLLEHGNCLFVGVGLDAVQLIDHIEDDFGLASPESGFQEFVELLHDFLHLAARLEAPRR